MRARLDSIIAGWPSRRLGLTLFALLFVVYHANFRSLYQVDCIPAPYTAWSLARHGSFALPQHDDLQRHVGGVIMQRDDGGWISKYPPGGSLIAVPFVAPFAWTSSELPRPSVMRRLGKLTAASCTAAAVVLFFFTCLALAPRAAPIATLLLGLGTELWVIASQAMWSHGPATLWLCVALYLGLARSERAAWRPAGVGLALGLAILSRPSSGLFALGQLGALLWLGRWRDCALTAVGMLPGAALLLGYNLVQFGAPFSGGYLENLVGWSGSIREGLFGLLLAPSRGLLVYAPALLLVPWGVAALVRDRERRPRETRVLLLGWLGAALASLLFYARWRYWWGGWCFGPRYLCETLPILCLAFALGYERLRSRAGIRLAQALVALSIATQVIGVFGDDGGAWNLRHPVVDAWSIRDTQIAAHLRRLLGLGAD